MRPEGWNNPYYEEPPMGRSRPYVAFRSKECEIYEAGADKVLELLKKMNPADVIRLLQPEEANDPAIRH